MCSFKGGAGITLNGGGVPNEHLDSDSLTSLCHRFAMRKLVSQSAGGTRLIVDAEKSSSGSAGGSQRATAITRSSDRRSLPVDGAAALRVRGDEGARRH